MRVLPIIMHVHMTLAHWECEGLLNLLSTRGSKEFVLTLERGVSRQAPIDQNHLLARGRVDQGDLLGASWPKAAHGASAVAVNIPGRREDSVGIAACRAAHPLCWVHLRTMTI